MTHEYVLALADSKATLANVGGKGASLARLSAAGLPVPDGFHLTTAAYQGFVAANDLQPRILAALERVDTSQPTTFETASRTIRDLFANAPMPHDIADAIAAAYLKLAATCPAVAVRSSATAEDLPDLSFAGQQETYLNIEGIAAVQDAVKRCWASLWTPRAIGYRAQHNIDHSAVALAVVVQMLVCADAAGVMFTANPVNGRRDQVVINAAWGLGEAIVGGAVTPDTFIVDKTTERVIEREISDKHVMTVRVDHGTEERHVPEHLRRATVLSDRQAIELARFGTQIEKLYRMPMDMEWTLAQDQFAMVQARPITALPQVPITIEWLQSMPDPKGKYLRASIVDLMPDPVSPLFATMGFGALSAGMNRAMSELTKSKAALPQEYIVTINDYAFQNARMDGRMAWWLLTRLVPSMPRMLRSGLRLWRENVHPRYVEIVRRWEDKSCADLSSIELLNAAREITDAAMYNLAWQLSWMGAAAGSEALFTRVYEKMVKREGDPAATTFVMGYNSTPIRAEKSLYDLAAWCRAHDEIAASILNRPSDQLAVQLAQADARAGDWQEFQKRFRSHLREFGHLIYDLDFAKPLPLDDPSPMLETLKMYLRGEGMNPHERQQTLETKRVRAVENALRRIKGLRRWVFTKALNWAQPLAEAREDGIAAIGLGYPLVRQLLRELGRRLVAANVIEQPDDIFWLRENELEQAVAILTRGESSVSMVERIQERRNFSRTVKSVTPPTVLPPSKRVWGVKVESFTAADESSQTGSTLKGAGTSAGRVTAPARVLHGPEDFDQMKPGEVLVAGITTPAWTPLFAMASGVVTDIGGPLSHGSIVAREYGIPAVMGTGVATKRIRSGQVITVDGSAGTVTLKGGA
jgi:pyruvate,water dikinase